PFRHFPNQPRLENASKLIQPGPKNQIISRISSDKFHAKDASADRTLTHYLQLAEEEDGWYYCSGKSIRQDATGDSGRDLGHELDLLAKWKVRDDLELFCGYSHFFPESFVKDTGTHGDADWVFLQVTYFF
ncbi:MAG: alginate export family protein, partial [bacterium]